MFNRLEKRLMGNDRVFRVKKDYHLEKAILNGTNLSIERQIAQGKNIINIDDFNLSALPPDNLRCLLFQIPPRLSAYEKKGFSLVLTNAEELNGLTEEQFNALVRRLNISNIVKVIITDEEMANKDRINKINEAVYNNATYLEQPKIHINIRPH